MFAKLQMQTESNTLDDEIAAFDPKNNLWDLARELFGAYGGGRQSEDVYLSCESVGGILRQLKSRKSDDTWSVKVKKIVDKLLVAYDQFQTDMKEYKFPTDVDKKAVTIIWKQYYRDLDPNWYKYVPYKLHFADDGLFNNFNIWICIDRETISLGASAPSL